MNDVAISVKGVSKSFKLPHEKHTGLKQMVLNFKPGQKNYEIQKALNSITMEVKRGEFFGIIGRNGSGKSTLLKILAGIYQPTTGSVAINGNLVPFIELGVGFNPELTGRDNVYLNAALLGFSQKQTDMMYQDIVSFAELEAFMDQKLKNYSSGMQVRLAFSIAIRARSDILLIDEVLAVGDANFQKKCIGVFEQLKREGRTIVFVSHSMGYIKDFCDRVAVVNQGEVHYIGSPNKAVDIYNKLNLEKDVESAKGYLINAKSERLGTGGARIEKYTIRDQKGKETKLLKTNAKYSIKMEIDYNDKIKNPTVGVMFKKNPAENLYGINNYYENIDFGSKVPGDKSIITIDDIMPLNPGDYYISLSIVDAKSSTDYEELDFLDNIAKITVFSDKEEWAIVNTKAKIVEQKL